MTLLTGCVQTKDFGPEDVSTLIFQSEYTNNAWGYNHNGWVMDSTGKVKRFQKSAPWVFPDSLGYIAEKDMQKNFSVCDSVLTEIDPQEFSLYAEKALTCVDGTLTKPENKMFDAGEHANVFYLYGADRKRYKRVILKMSGDWSQDNLAPNAKEVVDWMIKIND